MDMRQANRLEKGFFWAVALLVTAAFALVMAPFFAALLWAVIAAIMFDPVNRRLLARMPGRPGGAAGLTLLLIIAMVIVPTILLAAALIQEAAFFYNRIQTGQIDFREMFAQMQAALPDWAAAWSRRLGLTDFAAAREMLARGVTSSFRTVAGQALLVGQSALGLIAALGVMLYVTFFLLRDADDIMAKVGRAAPLPAHARDRLVEQFAVVIRATIKGGVAVAIMQGAIGGLIFWALGIQGALLWGVLMGAFSLLPAIGTGLIWVPVALYLLATGALWQGAVLVFCGIFVIGMVDNLLRPMLVGRDTRMPDWLILVSTLGGIELFGFSGIIVGPVIAALFLTIWTMIAEERTAL
jgi:predicted PurR-regulated permease PerM